MSALLAMLVAATSSADAQPKSTEVSAVALPPVSAAQQYGAPGSLPPVTAQLFHLRGLTEVQPMLLISVGDPFWRTVGAGLRLEHHLDERWSFSAHAIGDLTFIDAPVSVCSSACSAPDQAALRAAPGKLQFLGGVEASWAPIYGKLSLFGDATIHFDAYLSLGPELVRELIAPDTASPAAGRWAPGGRASLGERIFITNTFMVRVAASELVYAGNVRGNGEIERKLSFEGGLAWLFGVGR